MDRRDVPAGFRRRRRWRSSSERRPPRCLVGAVCCAAAYAIFRVAGRNDLAAQFGLAVSLAGQVMFVFGLREAASATAGTMRCSFWRSPSFEGALAGSCSNFVHRVWSTFASMMAFGYAMTA